MIKNVLTLFVLISIGMNIWSKSYSSWDRRRNATTLKESGWSADFTRITDKGFGGHEHVDELQLINMGGRMYDPWLGRFLSPDIVVQFPENAQSYNRYSYCLNNPLRYIDPSGWTIAPPDDYIFRDGVLTGYIPTNEPVDRFYSYGIFRRDFMNLFQQASDFSIPESGTVIEKVDDISQHALFSLTGKIADFNKIDYSQLSLEEYPHYLDATYEYPGMATGRIDYSSFNIEDMIFLGKGIASGAANLLSNSAAKGGNSFFQGTKYTNKVLGQMKSEPFHAFPESVKAFESSGVISTTKGGDGITRQMLKIPGEYGSKKGFFEFIKEADASINHIFFRPNP